MSTKIKNWTNKTFNTVLSSYKNYNKKLVSVKKITSQNQTDLPLSDISLISQNTDKSSSFNNINEDIVTKIEFGQQILNQFAQYVSEYENLFPVIEAQSIDDLSAEIYCVPHYDTCVFDNMINPDKDMALCLVKDKKE